MLRLIRSALARLGADTPARDPRSAERRLRDARCDEIASLAWKAAVEAAAGRETQGC